MVATALLFDRRMPQVPEALMRGDEALDAAAAVAVGVGWAPGQHDLENAQQVLGNLKIRGVAGMVERDQHLIGKPTSVAWQAVGRTSPGNLARARDHVVFILLNSTVHDMPHFSESIN